MGRLLICGGGARGLKSGAVNVYEIKTGLLSSQLIKPIGVQYRAECHYSCLAELPSAFLCEQKENNLEVVTKNE